jgi:hypothetical protein
MKTRRYRKKQYKKKILRGGMPKYISGFDHKKYDNFETQMNRWKKFDSKRYNAEIQKLVFAFRKNSFEFSNRPYTDYQYLFEHHMNSIIDVLDNREISELKSSDKYDKFLDQSEPRLPSLPDLIQSSRSEATLSLPNATGVSNSDSEDSERNNGNWFGGKRRTRRRKTIKRRS